MANPLNDARGYANTLIDWLRFLIGIVLWCVLFLIVVRAAGLHQLPDPGDIMRWIYVAGMYWLIK